MQANKYLIYCTISLVVFLLSDSSSIYEPSNQIITPSSILGVDYDYIYCQAADEVRDHYVPARDFKALIEKGGGTLGDFQVTYNGFTTEAREAFQYAVDIWDMLLDSEAKIVVSANFADLNSGTLGSAAPTGFYENFSAKAERNIEYAGPLAEKIAGQSLNRSDPDLSCNFSNTINWFYDFENPELIGNNQYDFVSVVLHELGHGLGFLSRRTFSSNSGNGFIGAEAPIETDIFSLLLETGDGTNLLLNLEDGSPELGAALVGRDLFFDSHSVSRDPLPEIFAPNPWNSGSSLSHLDEGAHGGIDALMTPSIGRMEVLHDPAVALTMMHDMGWNSSFIGHDVLNKEIINQPIPIEAQVFTDAGIGFDTSGVKLVYSQDSFLNVLDTLSMSFSGTSGLFSANLPAVSSTGRYQYYIMLDDTINNQLTSPKLAAQRFHDILVGQDNDAPVIAHTPILFYFLDDDVPTVNASISDEFTGVANVSVQYRVNNEPLDTLELSLGESNEFSRQLQISFPFLDQSDSISYRIIAVDNAVEPNFVSAPSEGFYVIDIKSTPDPVDFYENDFNTINSDFTSETFSIRTEDGFDDGALHSEHPYINAGTGNEFNFIARLRVPIQIVEGGTISFDEVVLVEPGEPNTSFGDSEFWDYVIVEASEDNGGTWTRLLDGYDSSAQSIWKSTYDAGVSGTDSSADGDKSMLINREFLLHQPARGFDVGDQVILRWRLFSDPFAVGWGWVIDNLIIQQPNNTTPLANLDEEDKDILLSPNPITDEELNISILGELNIRSLFITDVSGKLLHEESLDGVSSKYLINVSTLKSGIYFAVFKTDDIWITKPFIKL